jgi:hypothetical protein
MTGPECRRPLNVRLSEASASNRADLSAPAGLRMRRAPGRRINRDERAFAHPAVVPLKSEIGKRRLPELH